MEDSRKFDGNGLHGSTVLVRLCIQQIKWYRKGFRVCPAKPRKAEKGREAGAKVREFILVHEFVHPPGFPMMTTPQRTCSALPQSSMKDAHRPMIACIRGECWAVICRLCLIEQDWKSLNRYGRSQTRPLNSGSTSFQTARQLAHNCRAGQPGGHHQLFVRPDILHWYGRKPAQGYLGSY